MIIENFIDHYVHTEEKRRRIKIDAALYVEEDHVDEIAQAFPETAKPNGFRNWLETFYEMVAHLASTGAASGSMSRVTREQGGRTALWTLAESLTDEFEDSHRLEYDNEWADVDFFDAIDSFLKKKQYEQYKLNHGL